MSAVWTNACAISTGLLIVLTGCGSGGNVEEFSSSDTYQSVDAGPVSGVLTVQRATWLFREQPSRPGGRGDCRLEPGKYNLADGERGVTFHRVKFAAGTRILAADGSECAIDGGFVWRMDTLLALNPVVQPSGGGSSSPVPSQGEVETFPALNVWTGHLYDQSPAGAWDFTLLSSTEGERAKIPSPCAGTIANVRAISGYGNTLEVRCDDGYIWFMAHLAGTFSKSGTHVNKGHYIARQGSTGNSTGPHIHLEIGNSSTDLITDRKVTEPLVRAYFRFVQSGGRN